MLIHVQYFGNPLLDDDDGNRLDHYGILDHLAGLNVMNEPSLFLASVSDHATISHLHMALDSTTADDFACEVFES